MQLQEMADARLATAATPLFPSVSVVIPARNAEATIAETLDSVLSQEYAGSVEILVADGSDTPATSDVIRQRYPTVKLLPNERRTTGFGIDAMCRVATGEFILRCDAHTILPPGYMRRAVETLRRTGAANVGGRQQPIGITFFERAVAIAMTTLLGTGGARHRMGGAEGPNDTAFLGVFRRDALDEVGGFDPTFIRNQDYEFNWRLRKRGETVWFDPELIAIYRPRGSLRALASQYFDYGRWKRVMLQRHPASLLPRHLACPLLMLALAASVALALAGATWAAAVTPLTYFLVLAGVSLATGIRRRSYAALLLLLILATMHVSWGLGFFSPVRVGRNGGGGGGGGSVGDVPACNGSRRKFGGGRCLRSMSHPYIRSHSSCRTTRGRCRAWSRMAPRQLQRPCRACGGGSWRNAAPGHSGPARFQ